MRHSSIVLVLIATAVFQGCPVDDKKPEAGSQIRPILIPENDLRNGVVPLPTTGP